MFLFNPCFFWVPSGSGTVGRSANRAGIGLWWTREVQVRWCVMQTVWPFFLFSFFFSSRDRGVPVWYGGVGVSRSVSYRSELCD